jgi:hypothetical protein
MKTRFGRRARTAAWRIALLLGIGGFALLAATGGFWLSPIAGPSARQHQAAAKGASGGKNARAAKKTRLAPYTVKVDGTSRTDQPNTATAACDPGDHATGGGFEGAILAGTRIESSSPFTSIDDPAQADAWTVIYENREAANAVTAVVVCADTKPKHT